MLDRTLMTALCLAALAAPAFAQGGEVNVYSYREHKLIQPLLDGFTKDTEIKVNVISANSGLEQRIKTEGENSPADLLLSTPQPATAAFILNGAALVALGRARPEQAARLLAAAEATHERIGTVPVGAERREMELVAEAVEGALDPGTLAAARDAGRALDPGAVLRELVASA